MCPLISADFLIFIECVHTPQGVRIYSLGPNMTDDDGHNSHDDPHPNCPSTADDIAIELK